jgi:predicted CXXCH cytochrome family protein
VLVVSCGDVQRHAILTFFFDGVPPLAGEGDPNAAGYPGSRRGAVQYEHAPRKDCEACHVKAERRKSLSMRSLADVQRKAPVPALCYGCHSDYAATSDYVHGPVAVGQCLFCHEPHQAPNKYLLKRPLPELCYACHDKEGIESIVEHQTDVLSRCMVCHEGHSGSTKGLLKKDWKEK